MYATTDEGVCILETVELEGYTVRVVFDTDPIPPWDSYDDVWGVTHWSRRYNLLGKRATIGTYVQGEVHYDTPNDFEDFASKHGWVYLPFSMLNHSGISIKVGSRPFVGDSQGWDSGAVGFVYMTPEKIRRWLGCKYVTAKRRKDIEQTLAHWIDVADDFYTGQVFAYEILDSDGDVVDSCGGFFGDSKAALEAATDAINYI